MNGQEFTKKQRHYLRFKRFLDIFVTFFAIIILTPFLFLIGLLVVCTSKGPVFFRQKRVGKDKKYFAFLNFER